MPTNATGRASLANWMMTVRILFGAMLTTRGKTMPPRSSSAVTVDFSKPPSKAAASALGRVFTASLLTSVMAESIALFGFTFGFIIHDDWPYYPYALVAIAVDLL